MLSLSKPQETHPGPVQPDAGVHHARVGIWVTATLTDGLIRGSGADLRGTQAAHKRRPVQEEDAGGEGQN